MQKYPAGFYVLGIEQITAKYPKQDNITERRRLLLDPNQDSVVSLKRWSLQGLRMLEPGEHYAFCATIQNNSKCFTVHAWGLCRLDHVLIGEEVVTPIDGALFIDIDRVIHAGTRMNVIVQALDFELPEDSR